MTIRIPKIKHIHRKSESTISDVVIKLVTQHNQGQTKYKEIIDEPFYHFATQYKEKHGEGASGYKPRHFIYTFERYLRRYYDR